MLYVEGITVPQLREADRHNSLEAGIHHRCRFLAKQSVILRFFFATRKKIVSSNYETATVKRLLQHCVSLAG
jgi:hypothetical protein